VVDWTSIARDLQIDIPVHTRSDRGRRSVWIGLAVAVRSASPAAFTHDTGSLGHCEPAPSLVSWIVPTDPRCRRREAIGHLAYAVAELCADFLEKFGVEVVRADPRDLPFDLVETSDCHQDLCVAMHDKAEHHWLPLNGYPLVEKLGRAQL